MDTTRDVIYRGVYLNNSAISLTGGGSIGTGIAATLLTQVDFSDTDVIQFREKRSEQDGMDAGPVWQGARRIHMAGTCYDLTRNLLFDRYWKLRAALNPVLAMRESPADKGYRPLTFFSPTNRTTDYPTGIIDLQMLAMPLGFHAVFDDSNQGGNDADSLAIPWTASFICKDPSITSQVPADYVTAGAGPFSGNFVNRGYYLCSVNALWVVSSAAATIVGSFGGSLFTITLPSSTGVRTIRFKGKDKIITVEEAGVEVPRMDIIQFSSSTTWPQVTTGSTAYSITTTNTFQSGSHVWFYETYA